YSCIACCWVSNQSQAMQEYRKRLAGLSDMLHALENQGVLVPNLWTENAQQQRQKWLLRCQSTEDSN
ncbi:MAG: hypothetical protein AAFP69_20385, partial [Planctomycetota bacterium]